MRLIWHIFKKDLRHLWLEGTVTIGLLAWWAYLDRWRWGFTPNPMEGWLDILLPFAWAYLVGLLVLQDPLVGDRQFWVTLPVRWRSVLAAKALFALALIHLPYFAAQAAILWFRGFEPSFHLPHLLWRQLVLLAVIVLPAAAIATIVKNVVQFTLAAVLVSAAVIFLSGGVLSIASPWIRVPEAPLWLALLAAFIGAAAIVVVQYRERRTTISRVIGAIAAVAAIAIYTWLPPAVSAAFDAAVHATREGATLTFTLSPSRKPVPKSVRPFGWGGQAILLALPYEIGGLAPDELVDLSPISLEIHGANGATYGAAVSRNRSRLAPLFATLWDLGRTPFGPGKGDGAYLVLTVDRSLYARLRSAPVTLEGTIMARLRHRGEQVSLAVGARADVPNLGKCSSAPVAATYTYAYMEMLKVSCESTGDIPYPTRVALVDQGAGRAWRQWLGDAGTFPQYPQSTWLSPLNQRDTFFHITSEETYQRGSGSHYTVPREVLATAKIEIGPEFPAGDAVIKFGLLNVNLTDYELPPDR